MKKILLVLSAVLFLQYAFATVHEVQVSNFQFSPATVDAVVGDTMKWVWGGGFHTTTSTSVPNGASTWDAPMQSANDSFVYVLTVAGTYNYFCSIHPTSMTATLNVTGALPVVLNNFTISPGKANTAMLAWATATEQNTDHFEVMRSTNGSNFQKVTTIPAAGNSSVLLQYTYTDIALPATASYLYYSLTIVDKDGKKTSSGIKMFRNANSVSKLIASLSPNPISRPGHLMLQFNSEKENTLHVQLFNAAGKLVKQTDMTAVTGLNNGHFHIGDVPAGTYTVIFTMDGLKESYKIVVQ